MPVPRPSRDEAIDAVRTLIRWAGDDPARHDVFRREKMQRARRTLREIEPHRLTGRRERGMRQRKPERFADDL